MISLRSNQILVQGITFMDFVLFIPVIISNALTFLMSLGFISIRKKPIKSDTSLPSVSVVVTARNEEKDLPACILALEKLDYPVDKLQIILVDDRSTDSTRKIINEASARNNHFITANTDNYRGSLEAKARGLHCGIAEATGEWILITDADAEVPVKWAKTMISHCDENTGCISGSLSVPSGSLRAIVEKLTYAFALPIAYGYGKLFRPFMSIGPNMGVKKAVYDQVGGLEGVEFDVAEDLAIFHMSRKTKTQAIYVVNPSSLVEISPVPTLGHIGSQLTRWIGGSFEQGFSLTLMIGSWFGISFLCSLSLLLAPFLLPSKSVLILWGIKIFVDTFTLSSFIIKTKARNNFSYIPLIWFIGPLIFLTLPFLMMRKKKVTWKGEGYEVKY